MSADDRFKPPAAVVDDVGVTVSRGPLIVFGMVGLIQFAWLAAKTSVMLQLVSANALPPIGLPFAFAGEICLAVAIYRAIWLAHRPQRMFAAAVVLLAIGVAWWHALPLYLLGLFVTGMVVAAICWSRGQGGRAASATGTPT